ncbi:lipopolysaccharide assembly protein LapA domain-containing protein [Jeotgalibaca ciconiae]|uniref:DUF1049 domain-containing protein n=1 Tax=Jeotgalibaca ciconiae TaxID=2496265 RepID=A0A3Q9BM72_9LACT|nr:lipopolysaccharide assembly protein LapA domain-containing protein [Jeotgalibaca ciconiae]AZP05449.1 DUF1049 domain-containing protein [Jeotgalibaca ciconiae]HJB24700.1 DUF1049 domain-containing protein [Candidatus Jeotgalibaca pullicola]
MKNQWRLILVIILMIIISIFAILNVDNVPVNFGFANVAAPLIIIIFVSLLLGSLLTLLVSTITNVHNKKELKTLRSEIEKLETKSDYAKQEVMAEYNEKITQLEETIISKENKIKSLENELVNQYTQDRTTFIQSDESME